MKSICLIAFLFLLSFKHDKNVARADDGMLKVDSVIATPGDIQKIFFLLKEATSIKNTDIIIKYEPNLSQLFFLINEKLIGYYNVQKGEEIIINNFSSLRGQLSFKDLREREYRLKIEQNKDKGFVLRVTNYGEKNKLSQSITIIAHEYKEGFALR